MGFQNEPGCVVYLPCIESKVVISFIDNIWFIAVVNNLFGPSLRVIVL